MSKKDIYYKILYFTSEKDWMDQSKIVEEVQKLGRMLSVERAAPIRYQDVQGVAVIDKSRNIRKYSTIEECVTNERLCRVTINKHIRNKSRSKDGRTFFLIK